MRYYVLPLGFAVGGLAAAKGSAYAGDWLAAVGFVLLSVVGWAGLWLAYRDRRG